MLSLIPHNLTQVVIGAFILGAALGLRMLCGGCCVRRGWLAQASGIVLVASAIGAAYHAVSDDGLISRYENVRAIRLPSSLRVKMPRVELTELRRTAADGSATLIDARSATDFEAGHIPGAVNVPLDLVADERRERIALIPKDRTLIVYCSRESCDTAEVLGAWLGKEGFTDVRVFGGGWDAWVATTQRSR